MTVDVESAGFLTTIQDLGRTGFREQGVALGGALYRPGDGPAEVADKAALVVAAWNKAKGSER